MKKFLAISLAVFACALGAPQFAFGADSANVIKY